MCSLLQKCPGCLAESFEFVRNPQDEFRKPRSSRKLANFLPNSVLNAPLIMDIMVAPGTFATRAPAHATRLENGLTVLIKEVHTAPLVSVWCWYRVGSGDEVPGLTGVSHWVEHMNFKGTTNIPRDEMKGIVERFGGTWNGYTWIDQTDLSRNGGKDALDTLLFIEAERMANGLYEPGRVRVRANRHHLGAAGRGERSRSAARHRGHGDSLPAAPVPPSDDRMARATCDAMSRDDLYGYYRRHYVPDNATLVVVGDVDADEVLRGRAGAFRAIPACGPRPRAVGPPSRRRSANGASLLEREGRRDI